MFKNIFSILGMVLIIFIFSGCQNENLVDHEENSPNDLSLNKEVYSYGLIATEFLPNAYGNITIKQKQKDEYSFSLKAFNLEPGVLYGLQSILLPCEVVYPYVITTEPTAIANSNGKLTMGGKINLFKGETILLFTVIKGYHKIILKTENPLF